MKKIFCLIIIVLFDLSIYHNILACAPVEDFPDNEIDTDCSISLFDHSCAFTKTETRYVRWPGKEDIAIINIAAMVIIVSGMLEEFIILLPIVKHHVEQVAVAVIYLE